MSRGHGAKVTSARTPVKQSCTIMAAFERQTRKKDCPICKQSVLLTLYRAHLDGCQLTSNDNDCEIVNVLSGAESRALHAGPPIVIDDSEGTNSDPSQKPSSSVTASKWEQKRSKRLKTSVETVDEIEIIKVECVNACKVDPENCPPDIKKAHDTGGSNEVVPSKRPRKSSCCSYTLSESRVEVTIGNVEEHAAQAQEEEKIPSADDVVKKIERLLSNVGVDFSSQEAASDGVDQSSQSTDFKRMPYIVKFTLLMMRRVLLAERSNGARYDESFWQKDMVIFDRFVRLSRGARELFMRLHLRKSWWLTLDKLKERYTELSTEMESTLVELVRNGFVDGDKSLSNLEEALKVAPLPALKSVAKIYQLDTTKGKIELTTMLTTFSTKQKGLFGQMGSVAVAMLRAVKKELGPCYRVNREASEVFKALFTLYAPTEMCSSLMIDQPSVNLPQTLLYTLLRMDQGVVRFPAPNPCLDIISIYENKDELMTYVRAKELETELLNFLSNNKFEDAYECAYKAREMLSSIPEERRAKAAGLPVYLRRFTAISVLMRCVAHGAGVLERQKKYAIAISWQRYLLKTPELKPFCMNHRGALWDRLSLNLDAHLKERDEALQEIREGLEDDAVADKDKLMLQDRALRISNRDFLERIVLAEPVKKVIYGTTLSKDLGDSRINRFVVKDIDNHVVECSVEEVVRMHYLDKEGFNNGVHAEGSIWHTVLGLLFYDIIFDPNMKNVWLSEVQTNPVDLATRSLYEDRRERFDERFSWLEKATDEEITDAVKITWVSQHMLETSEINWSLFEEVGEFLNFLFCCPRLGLIAVLRRVVTDYRNCRSGFPDLTVWNTVAKTIAVVEVKGPGDRLSTKQRLWLDFFMRHEIRAEVCHVIARSDRELR
uniref:Fanconi-associated nuclease n=1 Tax=Haemonchus contortus TaxID=6289 RepID=A0A7I4YSD0_HAECO|nr:VRR-NUC domain containing protein [Haemonchus contortus]